MVQLKDDDSDSADKSKTKMREAKATPAWPAVLFAVAVALIATGVYYMAQSKTGCPFHFGKSDEASPHSSVASPHSSVEQPTFGSGASLPATYSGQVLTKQQLSQHGQGSSTPWVSVLGHVYDVSTGMRYYGDGATYDFFTGKDGSRAYSTGQFDEEGLTDDVSGLKPEAIGEIYNWLNVFGKKYPLLGRLEGPFFTSEGIPTPVWRNIESSLASLGEVEERRRELRREFPSCNSHYEKEFAEVWCTVKSGGIVRDWVGVPRQLHVPGESVRCACVRNTQLSDPKLQLYDNCDEASTKCKIKR